VGIYWPIIPKSYEKYRLTRFWGKNVLRDHFAIEYGALTDSRLIQPHPPAVRYIKHYHDGRSLGIAGPWGNIVGDCEIRASSYFIQTLSVFRRKAINVEDDVTGFHNLNRTFISLGSPSSNEISDFILRQTNNTFLKFNQNNAGPCIEDINSRRQFNGFQPPIKKDYGLIVKIKNSRFPGHYFFVCAGLGEYGTSGASWYLATKWKEFENQQEFGIVIEVDLGSDESAIKVFP
jgi:hypothetical protein